MKTSQPERLFYAQKRWCRLVIASPDLLLSISGGQLMPRKIEKKERGVFEKEPGSDIWWIRYYLDGREHREKVGRRGDAIKLYKVRKIDALRGMKMPSNMKYKGFRFKVIAQEAIDWYIEHGRKDVKAFRC
jgi:hypothetical protein